MSEPGRTLRGLLVRAGLFVLVLVSIVAPTLLGTPIDATTQGVLAATLIAFKDWFTKDPND